MNPATISIPSTALEPFRKTNTIAVTSLPKAYFNHVILDVLHSHFATYGDINQWVPLPGFSRIIVVYNNEDDAELAKTSSDPIVLNETSERYAQYKAPQPFNRCGRPEVTLRVYRADPNPLVSHQTESTRPGNFLRPPELEKNFLISPPGSPPVGWEPIREDPPNSAPLAEDLIIALRKLQTRGSGKEVLLEPEDGSGVGVYVEDCDVDKDDDDTEIAEEDWVYGESAPARMRWVPIPTAMPPVRSAIVA